MTTSRSETIPTEAEISVKNCPADIRGVLARQQVGLNGQSNYSYDDAAAEVSVNFSPFACQLWCSRKMSAQREIHEGKGQIFT